LLEIARLPPNLLKWLAAIGWSGALVVMMHDDTMP
jgi:hypothetical protein